MTVVRRAAQLRSVADYKRMICESNGGPEVECDNHQLQSRSDWVLYYSGTVSGAQVAVLLSAEVEMMEVELYS